MTATVLGAVLKGEAPGRQTDSVITIFDSSGRSLQDLHMAQAILQEFRQDAAPG